MPSKPPRPCRQPFCPNKTVEAHGYCEQHKDKAVQWQSNRHSEKRTRGRKWQITRERILRRDNGLCQPCLLADQLTPATQVDHIRPLADGGTDTDANLQAICKPCHDAKTKQEAERGRQR